MNKGTKVPVIIGLCSAANFINSADRVIMPIAIIQMTEEFDWDMHGQGWVLSSFSIGYMASGILGGGAAKRYGGKLTLALAVFLWSAFTFITPWFGSSIYALMLLRVLLGIGEGLGLPAIFHIFSHTVTVEERSKAFGYLAAFGSIGQTVAAVVCPHLEWRWMFYGFGSIGFVFVVLWLTLYKEVRGPSGLDEEYAEPPRVITSNVQWLELLRHWPLWALYAAHFSMNWSNYIVMLWLPTYLHFKLHATKLEIMSTAMPYLMNSLISVASGHLADSLIVQRRWSVLSVRRLMTGVGLLGPGIFTLCFIGIDRVFLAVLCVSISMGLSGCNAAGHLSNHAEVAPTYAGFTFAISNTLGTIPGILSGPLTAELVTKPSGQWFPVFIIAALMNLVGGFVYISHSSASQIL